MAKKITKAEFEKMTKDYQGKNPNQTHAVRYDRASIEAILANKDVNEVAVYFSQENNNRTVALVGLDANSNILFDTATNLGGLCPPNCPPSGT